ncbi:phage portal protein [Sporosarcina sp. FSL W7-1349]|uniref:phage portal protein n=1 Tax=Sporosarcina sp. FSL W7-1349 TaxID=2921561 RepID=UPI0030F8E648
MKAAYFPYQGAVTETDKLNQVIADGNKAKQFELNRLEKEIAKFIGSDKRNMMLTGERYYEGEHDILQRKRLVIGEGGRLQEAPNLPNNKRVDNQYASLVDQKVNYLLAKPLTIETENEAYEEALKLVLNKRFHRLLRNTGEASLNHGITYLHPFYDEHGELQFKRFPGYEVLPFWLDTDHTRLGSALRIYTVIDYDGDREIEVTKVDHYTNNGIKHYIYEHGRLKSGAVEQSSYLTIETESDEGIDVEFRNWQRLPLIPFKYNHKSIPLIRRVKNLQDAYNKILSNFENHMDEDTHNTIIVLENYDGQNLGEFRRNLSQYGAVKVRSTEGSRGDVRTLEVTVNKDNYESILTLFKKAIIENGRGYDSKDDRMSNNPNQMNIQSMYLDIDLDANMIETEYQAAFEELLWFVNQDLANKGVGDFENEDVNIIFNRDVLINETEVIEGLEKSGYLSNETRIAQHPYIKDVRLEMKRLEAEQRKQMDLMDNYDTHFNQLNGGGADGQE